MLPCRAATGRYARRSCGHGLARSDRAFLGSGLRSSSGGTDACAFCRHVGTVLPRKGSFPECAAIPFPFGRGGRARPAAGMNAGSALSLSCSFRYAGAISLAAGRGCDRPVFVRCSLSFPEEAFFVRSASGGTRCAGVGVSGRHRRRLGCGRRGERAGFRKKVGCVAACGFCLSGDGRRDDVLFVRNLQFIVCGRAKMRVVWNAFIIFAIGCTDFGSGRRKP